MRLTWIYCTPMLSMTGKASAEFYFRSECTVNGVRLYQPETTEVGPSTTMAVASPLAVHSPLEHAGCNTAATRRDLVATRCKVHCTGSPRGNDNNTANEQTFCKPVELSITLAQHRSEKLPGPSFYLHQNGGFNFRGVAAALNQLLAGENADLKLPIGEAQHLVDLHLMDGFENHPLRVHDPAAATLHVIGAMPFASAVLAHATGDQITHEIRMKNLSLELQQTRYFLSRRRPFLLVYSHPAVLNLGKELIRTLGEGRTIMASSDPLFSRDFRWKVVSGNFSLHFRRGVTIPYVAHSLAYETVQHRHASRSRHGIMFHGGVGRYDFGLRQSMVCPCDLGSHHNTTTWPCICACLLQDAAFPRQSHARRNAHHGHV